MVEKQSRPKKISGETLEMNSPCGKIYVTMNDNLDTGDLIEVFVRFGKSGTCASLVANALTIITSYGLRSGMDVGDAIKGLIGHGCHKAPVVDGEETILSCVDAIGKAIRIHTGLVPVEEENRRLVTIRRRKRHEERTNSGFYCPTAIWLFRSESTEG